MTTSASLFASVLIAVLSACAEAPDLSGWHRCASGFYCPPETVCDAEGDRAVCRPLPPCGEAPDDDACRPCGDGVLQKHSEECDDGNLQSGDGCDANCKLTGCGNGVITQGEACDDGNTISRDGCELDCTLTPPARPIEPPRPACHLDPAIDPARRR